MLEANVTGELVEFDGEIVARLSPKANASLRDRFKEWIEGLGTPASTEFLTNLEKALNEDADGGLLTVPEAMAAFKSAIEDGY